MINTALIGGIYGKERSFRSNLHMTPETNLERELRNRGIGVETFSHYSRIDTNVFDIVHVHHLSFGAVRMCSDRSRTAFVYTSHDGALMMGRDTRLRRRWASRLVMSRADAVIALCQQEAAFQRQSYNLTGAVHAVIPNGIDGENYTYVPRRPIINERGYWTLLYVGQLIELKRVDVLLHALARLPQNLTLDLAYTNPALETPLQQLASRLGLVLRANFLGSKPPNVLAELYQRSHILVLPSAAESLPSVVTEAMLCGTPVVATDVGGIREQLGGYGVLVPPGDACALARAISYVFEHYQEFASKGRAMSEYARKRFSIEKMVNQHLELYHELIARKGPRRRDSALLASLNATMRVGVDLLCTLK